MTPADAQYLHDLIDWHAERAPDSLAVIDPLLGEFNFAHYKDSTEHLADVLREKGVVAGDRVLVVAENCYAALVSIFAVSRLGGYAIPVNSRMTALEIQRVIKHATPSAAIYTIGASQDSAKHAAAVDAEELDTAYGKIALARLGDNDPFALDDDNLAILLYTTGTTGDPKGVMLTHKNVIFGGKAAADVRELTPADRLYGVLPVTHVFGVAAMMTACAYSGTTLQLERRFTAEALFTALKSGVTGFPGVPQMHAHLMQYAAERGIQTLDSKSLRYVTSGAAPLDPVWKRKAEAFYGVPLQNGYGMTESTAGSCVTATTEMGIPDTSVGRPYPGVEIELDKTIASSSGDPDTGEVLVRGWNVMKGYFRNPEATKQTFTEDGWLRTGDLGRFDDDGNLHIVGRCKELIIRGGFNVYPPEVEAALNDHPQVIQSAVVGHSIDGNEEIFAFVQCADPEKLEADTLKAFVAERLTAYKRPTRIVISAELPVAATGKVLRHKLVEYFKEQLE